MDVREWSYGFFFVEDRYFLVNVNWYKQIDDCFGISIEWKILSYKPDCMVFSRWCCNGQMLHYTY